MQYILPSKSTEERLINYSIFKNPKFLYTVKHLKFLCTISTNAHFGQSAQTHYIIYYVSLDYHGILQLALYKFQQLTRALRHTPTPLSIRLAVSTVWSLQCVAYITGVVHYRVVGCTGESALAICGSTRITTGNSWNGTEIQCWWLERTLRQTRRVMQECSGCTFFTLHSSPAHRTGASVRSCAGTFILAWAGADSCTQMYSTVS